MALKQDLAQLEAADDVIIGAGFAGLAAGLRLAQFGRKVVILEKHTLPGGLNSYYYRPGKKIYDSGLHVLTNRQPVSRRWGLPFVYRQLGLDADKLPLHAPTAPSLVRLGTYSWYADSEGDDLLQQLTEDFPAQSDGLAKLWALLKIDQLDPQLGQKPSLAILKEHLYDRQLIDLLRLPVFLYGGYACEDVPFLIFRNIFRSLYLEGVGHPGTIKHWLDSLLMAFKEAGGQIFYRAGVTSIEHSNDRVSAVVLESGQRIATRNVVSSAGLAETQHMLNPEKVSTTDKAESISAIETTFCVPYEVAKKACPHPMVFYYAGDSFQWNPIEEPFKNFSISCSAHFDFPEKPEYCFFKIATYLGGARWLRFDDEDYVASKESARQRLESELTQLLPDVLDIPREAVTETMTPRTVTHYTSHKDGGIYGSQEKSLTGETDFQNLFLVGNDQGGIGVVGAMISGIVVANLRILTAGK